MTPATAWPRALLAAALLAGAAAGQAQTAAVPSTQDLIEQLKPAAPAPATAPTFGRNRNFTVQRADAAASAASAASTPGTASAAVGTAATTTSLPTPPVQPAPRPSVSLSVEFDFDSARLRPDSLIVLHNLAQALQSPALAQARFRVEGHTDATGRAEHNLRLSAQRAQAVSAWLAAQGVAPARLSAVGKGASELALPQDPAAAANRRVRIVNLD